MKRKSTRRKSKLKPSSIIKKQRAKSVASIYRKQFDWKERWRIFDFVTDSLSAVVTGGKMCVKHDKLGTAVKMTQRIGSPSNNAEVWEGFTFKNDYKLAVKKAPLNENDRGDSYSLRQLVSGESAWGEMAVYMFTTIMVMAKLCPNLPVLYKYVWCPNCKYENTRLKTWNNQPCLMMLNELAEGDVRTFLLGKKEIWNNHLVENMIFQVAVGLYTLEKYYNMTHNDLHWGNVLVHEIAPGGFWEYKINGKTFFLPNLGYLFVVWDFGDAHIPGKILGRVDFNIFDSNPKKLNKSLTKNATDLGQFCESIYTKFFKKSKILDDKKNILKKILKSEGKISLEEIISTYFPQFLQEPAGHIIDKFNMDIPKNTMKKLHPKELQYFLC